MEKVRVGLIGTGTWGNTHAQTYTEYSRAVLAAVCDLSEERARKAAAQYGVSQVYTDYRKMLKDDGVDAVAIVTPGLRASRNHRGGGARGQTYHRRKAAGHDAGGPGAHHGGGQQGGGEVYGGFS